MMGKPSRPTAIEEYAPTSFVESTVVEVLPAEQFALPHFVTRKSNVVELR